MARKKAKDLETLLRLNRWIVDERRRELGLAYAKEERLIAEREALAQQLVAEKAVASADPTGAGFMFGSYVDDHRTRRERIEAQIAEAHQDVLAAQERLADAYRQLKVYEEVKKNRTVVEAEEEARVDQTALDEIAANLYRRTHSDV